MQSVVKLGIKGKLVIYFLLMGIIPCIIIGVIAFNSAKNALEHAEEHQLESVNGIKKSELADFFLKKTQDIEVFSNLEFVKDAIKELELVSAAANEKDYSGLAMLKYKPYRRVHDKYHEQFKHYVDHYGYHDVFLISKTDGHVFYTTNKEPNFGDRLSNSSTGLARVWKDSRDSGKISLSDAEPYAPSNGIPAQFMALPVIQDNEVIGLVAFQIPIDHINEMMTLRVGMGETGETYLVGPKGFMRSDSFLNSKDYSVTASFAKGNKIKSTSVTKAHSGKAGFDHIIDYNGNPVLSAYDYIDLTKGVRWAIITEIDVAEAFEPVYNLRNMIIILSLVLVGLIVLVGSYVGNHFSDPIIKCLHGIKRIAIGKFEKIEDVKTADEISDLADAINGTIDSLSEAAEVTAKYRDNLEKLPTPVMEIDKDFNVLFMNDIGAQLLEMTPDECKGKKCYDLFKTTNCLTEGCATMRAMRSGGIESDETVARPKAGVNMPISFTGKAIKDSKGEVVGALEFIMDQTSAYDIIRRISGAITSMDDISSQLSQGATLMGSSSEELASQTTKVVSSVEEINSVLSTMAAAAEESNSSSTSMASGAEETNASMKNVASSIEDLSTSFSDIAKNTSTGSQVALEAASQAQDVNSAMNALIEVADRVGEVVQVIGSIASQTNMLALNATIEAARAGESGKGFAVVANEVKELSKQTSNSSVDISNKIKDIQDAAQDANKKIERINEIINNLKEQSHNIATTVEEQTSIAKEIATVVDDTVDAANSMSVSANEVCKGSEGIAKSTGETSLGMQEITKAISDVNSAGTDLARNAQGVLKQSQGVAEIAADFKEIINEFQLLDTLEKE